MSGHFNQIIWLVLEPTKIWLTQLNSLQLNCFG